MLHCEIDHLTITAPSLQLGAAHVERALGVARPLFRSSSSAGSTCVLPSRVRTAER